MGIGEANGVETLHSYNFLMNDFVTVDLDA